MVCHLLLNAKFTSVLRQLFEKGIIAHNSSLFLSNVVVFNAFFEIFNVCCFMCLSFISICLAIYVSPSIMYLSLCIYRSIYRYKIYLSIYQLVSHFMSIVFFIMAVLVLCNFLWYGNLISLYWMKKYIFRTMTKQKNACDLLVCLKLDTTFDKVDILQSSFEENFWQSITIALMFAL